MHRPRWLQDQNTERAPLLPHPGQPRAQHHAGSRPRRGRDNQGKPHDYDTFLCRESVRVHPHIPRHEEDGRPRGLILPEHIADDSPLIRNKHPVEAKPVGLQRIYCEVHNLYLKAGLPWRMWVGCTVSGLTVYASTSAPSSRLSAWTVTTLST